MSPAFTKNESGVMTGEKNEEKNEEKEEKVEKEETQPRAELEASMRKKVLNESEPQEARRCKGWGKQYNIISEVGWWVVSYEHL